MLEKLMEAEKKYEDIDEKITQIEVITNQELMKKLMKERKLLEPVITKFREYKTAEKGVKDSEEMLGESLDPDMKEMVEEELEKCRADKERLLEELKIMLLPRDPNDDKSVIIEIRGGAGGDEAALFAHSLYRLCIFPVLPRPFLSCPGQELRSAFPPNLLRLCRQFYIP